MQGSLRKAALAAALSIAGVAGGLALAAPAHAQVVESGSVSFSGDPGDYITGGDSYSYSTDGGDQLTTNGSVDNSRVSVSISGYNGDWWSVNFDAPGSAALAPGTYEKATRYPFNGAGPGLDLSGNGRGCNELTGTFTVINAVFGPNGYVQTFDATFEQHCEGGTPAARGEVHIANPPPPAQLELELAVATDGIANRVNGNAVLHGTVTCNVPASVTMDGTVTQVVKKVIVRGSFSTHVTCTPGSPTPWTAAAVPGGTTPFAKGLAEAVTQANGYDTEYDEYVRVSDTTTVKLTRS
ncbi:hypothetical protein [Micromonospora sp. WMMD1155]|uniref:hypothetical protein n=1 Tax=Micromonospora sp. WMMD1155 TaxID=3016094 RepID=UPI00249BCA5A|nr:hypothetical protein [Micromonospora sp. WMMD1155]WFE50399.1 hypothetical protein O7617_08730 [Micromonospora sp. WMMD1155]